MSPAYKKPGHIDNLFSAIQALPFLPSALMFLPPLQNAKKKEVGITHSSTQKKRERESSNGLFSFGGRQHAPKNDGEKKKKNRGRRVSKYTAAVALVRSIARASFLFSIAGPKATSRFLSHGTRQVLTFHHLGHDLADDEDFFPFCSFHRMPT